jgi:hypothetical protein
VEEIHILRGIAKMMAQPQRGASVAPAASALPGAEASPSESAPAARTPD